MSLTPTLKKYAILSTNGMSGGGTVNIYNGNYGSTSTPTYDVTIQSVGLPQGENTADLAVATSDLQTLSTAINFNPPLPHRQKSSASSIYYENSVTYLPGTTTYIDSLLGGQAILRFNENSIITFDAQGNSNAVFVISAITIGFNNNNVELKNNAQADNIFLHAGSFYFSGENIIIGTFLCDGPIQIEQLYLMGHLFGANVVGVTDTLTIFNQPIVNVTGTLNIEPVPDPISDICFAKNTPIEVDQGIVMIQDLKPGVHTIGLEPIVAITRTRYNDDCVVCFEPYALSRNCPSQRTIVSKHHNVQYGKKMIPAHKFIGSFFNNKVHEIPYDGSPLYNILLKKHGTVRANNLVCETLDPKSIIAQLYMRNIMTERHVLSMNAFSLQRQKETKRNTFKRLLYKL